MNYFNHEKQSDLMAMLHANKSAAVIADSLRIPRAIAQKLRIQFISNNKKALFVAQKTTLAELSEPQLLRLKTLVSLDCSVGVICASLSMDANNVRALIKELQS